MKVRTRIALLAGAALLVAALGAACGGGGDDDANGNGGTAGNGSVSDEPITIVMNDNFFEPRDITVPVNSTVQITVQNEGIAIHNMTVLSEETEGEDFTSDTIVNPGGSSTFEVTFTSKGEFVFNCIFHLPDMVGTITVK